jgi:Tfp pilus assembly PilM family ATPase
MSKLLAVEWDEHEIRLAIASSRGGVAVLEKAFSVRLPPSPDGKPVDRTTIGNALRAAVSGEALRKAETLAVVGRPSIELKDLTLPPAPDEELPDMVRFQAMRDFTQLQDDWPLDFIPLSGSAEESHQVLAAAISPETLGEARAICEQADLDLKHLVLRPCASASLLARHRPGPSRIRLLVDMLGDEVDLTVLNDDRPIFMRTARLAGDSASQEQFRAVLMEIRRTIAAMQNRLHGRRVDEVHLCGDGPHQTTLAERIETELDLPTELFDPFANFEGARAIERKLPEHRSRFVPLLGMLADAGASERQAIDFINPRRRPAAKSYRREMLLGAALAAVLLLSFAGFTWLWTSSLDSDIQQLAGKGTNLDREIEKGKKVQREVAEIEKWMAGDVVWLDMLYRISTKAPKAQDAMLTGLTATTNNQGAVLKLEGAVRTHEQFKNLEKQLRAEKVHIAPGEVDQDVKSTKYPLTFKSDVLITPQMAKASREVAKAQRGAAGAKISKEPPADSAKKVEEKTSPPADSSAVKKDSADAKAEVKEASAETKSAPAETKPAEVVTPSSAAPAQNQPAPAPAVAPAATPSPAPAKAAGGAYGPPSSGKGE